MLELRRFYSELSRDVASGGNLLKKKKDKTFAVAFKTEGKAPLKESFAFLELKQRKKNQTQDATCFR